MRQFSVFDGSVTVIHGFHVLPFGLLWTSSCLFLLVAFPHELLATSRTKDNLDECKFALAALLVRKRELERRQSGANVIAFLRKFLVQRTTRVATGRIARSRKNLLFRAPAQRELRTEDQRMCVSISTKTGSHFQTCNVSGRRRRIRDRVTSNIFSRLCHPMTAGCHRLLRRLAGTCEGIMRPVFNVPIASIPLTYASS